MVWADRHALMECLFLRKKGGPKGACETWPGVKLCRALGSPRILVRERNLHLKDDVMTTEVEIEVRTLLVLGLPG